MKKIENIEQYKEVESKIVELLKFIHEDTPLTDPNYIQLEVYLNLIEEYDKVHFKFPKRL